MRSPRRRVSPGDLKEDLIHSLQKHVEVDEPEAEPTPMITAESGDSGEQEAKPAEDEANLSFDRMSEEELLRGLESMVPPDKSDDF